MVKVVNDHFWLIKYWIMKSLKRSYNIYYKCHSRQWHNALTLIPTSLSNQSLPIDYRKIL